MNGLGSRRRTEPNNIGRSGFEQSAYSARPGFREDPMNAYSINIIVDGRVSVGVAGEFRDDAHAISSAHYWLGYYRSDAVRLYRGLYLDAGPGDDADLIREIFTPS
jgi:hypothetical protein